MNTRFHVTVWPGTQIPVPPVPSAGKVEILDGAGEEGGPFLLFAPTDPQKSAVPPEELYLRELQELNVEDVGELAAFTERYGRLTPHLPLNELPGSGLKSWHRKSEERLFRRFFAKTQPYFQRHLEEIQPRPVLVSVEEVAFRIGLVRDLARVWHYHRGLLTFDDVASSWENALWPELQIHPWPSEEKEHELLAWAYSRPWLEDGDMEKARQVDEFFQLKVTPPKEPADLYAFLNKFLAAGLRSFHAHPVIYKTIENEETETLEESPAISLYSALCLQLANHIAEEATYHKCEKCGRPFVRQRGGAQFGQHRMKNVLYCSPECARAKAQQEYRKNRSQATRYAKEGLSVEEIAGRMDRDVEQVRKWIKPRGAK